MHKKRVRSRRLPPTKRLNPETATAIARLASAGPTAVTCLLAWLSMEHAGCAPAAPARFSAIAPMRGTDEAITTFLKSCGVLTEELPMTWDATRIHRARTWRLTEEFTDPQDAQTAALSALVQLR